MTEELTKIENSNTILTYNLLLTLVLFKTKHIIVLLLVTAAKTVDAKHGAHIMVAIANILAVGAVTKTATTNGLFINNLHGNQTTF